MNRARVQDRRRRITITESSFFWSEPWLRDQFRPASESRLKSGKAQLGRLSGELSLPWQG